jgi:hypothetical protein
LSRPRTKQDDGNWLLVGAGLLATILGAAGTFMLSNGGGNKNNGKSHTLSMTPGKKPCGCGMKKH